MALFGMTGILGLIFAGLIITLPLALSLVAFIGVASWLDATFGDGASRLWLYGLPVALPIIGSLLLTAPGSDPLDYVSAAALAGIAMLGCIVWGALSLAGWTTIYEAITKS